ncbi:MAG: hypothetical protein DYG98_19190 [Haliscomenobacteraceae bacterium CHB4]|nr:hypothetical protein [Haliscomenobacteraceae bacterium CHB4]
MSNLHLSFVDYFNLFTLPLKRKILYIYGLLLLLNGTISAQACLTPDPTPEEFQLMIEQLPLIEEFVAQRGSNFSGVIPVYFTVFRGADGEFDDPDLIAPFFIDNIISALNQNFSNIGLSFEQLGSINYIDQDILYSNPVFTNSYCYLQDALNFYVHKKAGGAVGGQPTQVAPNNLLNTDEDYATDYGVLTHEMGHSFGLMHTHGSTAAYRYDFSNLQNPVPVNQIDYPYNQTPNARELQIRDSSEGVGKTFPFPNWNEAGDLCGDTYPACNTLWTNPHNHPTPKFDQTNIANCLDLDVLTPCISGCPNNTYRDYNQDSITPDLNNFMSYYPNKTSFTDCQKNKMQFNYDTYRKAQYEGAAINLKDKVEFHGTSDEMKNVTIKWFQTDDPRFCRATSGPDGSFQGHLYTPNVKATVYKLGSGNLGAGPAQPDYYTTGDWLEGVTTYDLVLITKHILGITQLSDGYKKIAADANKSHSITTFDIVELRKLILGIYNKLPLFDAPWRFVPEYIPQDNQTAFDNNPFSMNINSSLNVLANQYLDKEWAYEILDGEGGKAGYDGIKIGDVNGSYMEEGPLPGCTDYEPTLSVPQVLMEADEYYHLTVKASNFSNIAAFQLGIQASAEKLEIEEVLSADVQSIIEEETYNISASEAGDNLSLAWFQEDGTTKTIADGQGLFKVLVKTLQPIANPAEVFQLKDKVLKSIFFTGNGCIPGGKWFAKSQHNLTL